MPPVAPPSQQVSCSPLKTECQVQCSVQCGDNQDACLVRIVNTQLSGYKFYSQCSTSTACQDTELQNFVGPKIYNQCRSSTMNSRFLRKNSVCSMCYKHAATNADVNLFFASAGDINTETGSSITVATLMASPDTYLDNNNVGTHIFTTQNW